MDWGWSTRDWGWSKKERDWRAERGCGVGDEGWSTTEGAWVKVLMMVLKKGLEYKSGGYHEYESGIQGLQIFRET